MLVRIFRNQTNYSSDTVAIEDFEKAMVEMRKLKLPTVDIETDHGKSQRDTNKQQFRNQKQAETSSAKATDSIVLATKTLSSESDHIEEIVEETLMDSFSFDEHKEEKQKDDGYSERFGKALQDLLDERGLNSQEGVQRLARLNIESIQMNMIVEEIGRVLNCDYQTAIALLRQWQEDQRNVEEQLQAQLKEQEKAKKEGRKALVPIWRCGVCGRADQPYIVCYVQPYIVRYEERQLK
jgi:hypothetical protein